MIPSGIQFENELANFLPELLNRLKFLVLVKMPVKMPVQMPVPVD